MKTFLEQSKINQEKGKNIATETLQFTLSKMSP